MFEKKKLWYICCSTGCTCCSNENFNQGFYDNEQVPNDIITKWYKGDGNPLASQFAKYGRYSLVEIETELLPDGRMIISDSVFDQDLINNPDRFEW